MPNLIKNPNFNPALGATPENQEYIFENPQEIINPQTAQTAKQASTGIITVDSLKNEKPIEISKLPINNDYAGIVNGAGAFMDNFPKLQTPPQDDLMTMLKGLETSAPESLTTTYGEEAKLAGIEEKNKAITDATYEFDIINSQIKDITASAQAQNLALEKQISGGGTLTAGSSDFLNRQQQEVNRQAAIKVLPLQAQALVAQAKVTQNTNLLKMAQDKLATVFDLRAKDAENQYNYNKDIRDKIWNYLTNKEKDEIKHQQDLDDRTYNESRDNLKLAQSWAEKAISAGQGDLATKIAQLDPNSPTFQQNLAKLQGQITIQPEVSTDIIESGGRQLLINKKTGETIKDLGAVPVSRGGGGGETAQDIPTALYAVGLSSGVTTNKGKLTTSNLNKLTAVGIPPDDAQEIIDKILSGSTLEEIRQWMRSLGVDPKALDTFMMTLQGIKNENQISLGSEGEAIINPFK